MGKSIQVQSVIYGNEKESLVRAMDNLSNSVSIEKKKNGRIDKVILYYGDSTPKPVFSLEEIDVFQKKYADNLEIKYKHFGFNSGSAKGHNILGSECNSDYMIIMNPDVIMSPLTISSLLDPFFMSEKVGMVEARQTPVEHQKEYDVETLETDWATTACAMFPTEIFNELNGFDSDTFFLYCDDLDFSWRVRLLGYKIIYQPKSPVYHAKHLGLDGHWMPTKAEIYYSAEAGLLMQYKWSNDELFNKTLMYLKNSADSTEREVVANFEKRKAENRLPEKLDPEHKVAKFLDGYYTENRYIL